MRASAVGKYGADTSKKKGGRATPPLNCDEVELVRVASMPMEYQFSPEAFLFNGITLLSSLGSAAFIS
jgi:hypothetical protein